eukprot:6214218-Pleurochrysis_carterae.AAC.3
MPLVGGADLNGTASSAAIRPIYGSIAHIGRVRPAYQCCTAEGPRFVNYVPYFLTRYCNIFINDDDNA